MTPGTFPINTLLDTLCSHAINMINIKISGTFLSLEQEQELVDLILEFSRAGFPMTSYKVISLACEFAQINNITGFSRNSQLAGKKWMELFFRCHPQIRVKWAHNLSVNWAMGTNPTVIHKFYISG